MAREALCEAISLQRNALHSAALKKRSYPFPVFKTMGRRGMTSGTQEAPQSPPARPDSNTGAALLNKRTVVSRVDCTSPDGPVNHDLALAKSPASYSRWCPGLWKENPRLAKL